MYKNDFQLVQKRFVLGLILIASCLALPAATGQGIFSELPYDESYIRSKIDQHAIKYDSITNPGAIPENIYYRLTFREILSDPSFLSDLNDADIVLINQLPAHEDHSFIVKDQQELTGLCFRLGQSKGTPADVVEAAAAFDASKQRRERDLNSSYMELISKLSPDAERLVAILFVGFIQSKNISYATFDMTGLATDEPGIAKAILLSGCDSFSRQLATYTPRSILLKDQLYSTSFVVGQ